MKKYSSLFIIVIVVIFAGPAAWARPVKAFNSSELQIALEKLNVLGSVLYYAAHPDDENTAALAYFSKGRKYRAAYLSVTRGDGGQNLIGPEKGAEIGIIRTQELLSARRIDAAEQFFTRAIDFGYSKTPEETFDFWGRDNVLADIVWIIRKFRPDVIITRFPTDRSSGHGHHTASGQLIIEAFHAAADAGKFTSQLKYVTPWQAKRLFWNSWRPDQQEIEQLPKVDTGEYNPLLGKSYSEIAAESRSKHKSQGFGAAARRGTQYNYFQLVAGAPASRDVFEGIDTSWGRISGGERIGSLLDAVIKKFDPQNPSGSLPGLLEVHSELSRLNESFWVPLKKAELLRVIQACAGLWLEATAPDFAFAPGREFKITATMVNRSQQDFKVEKIGFPELGKEMVVNIPLRYNQPQSWEETVFLPDDFPLSQPYWLVDPPKAGTFTIRDQERIGAAENPPAVRALFSVRYGRRLLEFQAPLLYRWTDRVDGELYRPVEIRPAVTLDLDNKVAVFPDNRPQEIKVTVKSQAEKVSGVVSLKASDNWKITPQGIPFSLAGKYAEMQAVFTVTPLVQSGESTLIAEAEVESKKYRRSLVEISYPHIERQVYFPESRMKLAKLDIKTIRLKLGYIMGAGDEVPAGLRSLGYEVTLLDDDRLDDMDFSWFDTIITGVRAYNTRSRLRSVQPKLLEFVRNGGTLIVQYNVSRGLVTDGIGPYPLTFGRERVSMEKAAVTFPDPNHPLLNFPNRITSRDFEGWVQERGLYFASKWDRRYQPVLASHDLNEPERLGGLLYAEYGKGIFIFTGYSWFRQLPAGVSGAFRLFVNMLSAGKRNE